MHHYGGLVRTLLNEHLKASDTMALFNLLHYLFGSDPELDGFQFGQLGEFSHAETCRRDYRMPRGRSSRRYEGQYCLSLKEHVRGGHLEEAALTQPKG